LHQQFSSERRVLARAGTARRLSQTFTWGSTLKIRLSIDRFEGDRKQIAVLLADDGEQINWPKKLLPRAAKAGDILTLSLERDVEATRQVAEQTRKVQDELKETDKGGDVKL
jgi:hypothetical protein